MITPNDGILRPVLHVLCIQVDNKDKQDFYLSVIHLKMHQITYLIVNKLT